MFDLKQDLFQLFFLLLNVSECSMITIYIFSSAMPSVDHG